MQDIRAVAAMAEADADVMDDQKDHQQQLYRGAEWIFRLCRWYSAKHNVKDRETNK